MTSNDIAPHLVQTSMVIDFGGQLSNLKHISRHYVDLSPQGNAAEACVSLFDVLRRSEGREIRQMGVTHVLLPDLSNFEDPKTAKNCCSDNFNDIVAFDEDNGLMSALWERMHRAASGIFL